MFYNIYIYIVYIYFIPNIHTYADIVQVGPGFRFLVTQMFFGQMCGDCSEQESTDPH